MHASILRPLHIPDSRRCTLRLLRTTSCSDIIDIVSAAYLTDYSPDWPAYFDLIRRHLADCLPTSHRPEHIGSTSIPGMAAKPIIDIDVVVPDGEMPVAIAALIRAGYIHQGDLGIPGREAFQVSSPATVALPPHHLYACEVSAHELRKHLAFRDYLRAHPTEAERLDGLKRHLAFGIRLSRAQYIEAKSPLIVELTAAALDWRTAASP